MRAEKVQARARLEPAMCIIYAKKKNELVYIYTRIAALFFRDPAASYAARKIRNCTDQILIPLYIIYDLSLSLLHAGNHALKHRV